jgi:hypothetical protein
MYAKLFWHYRTFLVAEHVSKPTEYKHVDQDKDVGCNSLWQLRQISPSLKHYI